MDSPHLPPYYSHIRVILNYLFKSGHIHSSETTYFISAVSPGEEPPEAEQCVHARVKAVRPRLVTNKHWISEIKWRICLILCFILTFGP